MKTILLTVFLFFLIIVPHEFGHFIAARLFGIEVKEFSVGMGPLLWQKNRNVKTVFSIRAIPFGGYCSFEADADSPDALPNRPAYQKIIVYAAGAIMNILTAFLLFVVITMSIGIPTTEINRVEKGSLAYSCGIRHGDIVREIDDTKITEWNDITRVLSSKNDDTTCITVEREGREKSFDVKLNEDMEKGSALAIAPIRKRDILRSIPYGIKTTWDMNSSVLSAFGNLLGSENLTENVSGPVGIIKMIDSSSLDWIGYLMIAAIICLNLALINMLPIPSLDGGRILITVLRKLFGEHITEHTENVINLVGMAVIMLFILYITGHDIVRLFR